LTFHMAESSDDDFDPQEVAEKVEVVPESKVKQTNEVAIKAKISELALPSQFKWVEILDVISPSVEIANVNDDGKREAAFYQATLEATKLGIKRLDDEKIPFMRPNDFFAEMIKPDEHMARIKDRLLNEKKRMQAVEDRIKHKAEKKYSKKVQAERKKEKAKIKKEHMDELAEFKKKRKFKDLDKSAPVALTSMSGIRDKINKDEEESGENKEEGKNKKFKGKSKKDNRRMKNTDLGALREGEKQMMQTVQKI